MHQVISRPEETGFLRGAARLEHRRRQDIRAALALLFDLGLRRAELCLTNLEDRRCDWVHCPSLKARDPAAKHMTKRERAVAVAERRRKARAGTLRRVDVRRWVTVYLSPGAKEAWDWLAAGRTSGPLIPGEAPDGRISPGSLYRWWKWAAAESALSPGNSGLSPHSARVSLATRMHGAGVRVRVIQAQLGHESIVSTERYLRCQLDDLEGAAKALATWENAQDEGEVEKV